MKNILLSSITAAMMISCGADDECTREDYIGLYVGSKMGIGCQDDSEYSFEVKAGIFSNEIIIDNHTVEISGCDIEGEDESFVIEGFLDGDGLRMVQNLKGGLGIQFHSCTWQGVKQ